MPESTLPILEFNYVSTSEATWKELVKYDPQPNKTAYIKEIVVCASDTTVATPRLKIVIDNDKKIDNVVLVDTKNTFSFGGDLKVKDRESKGIQVYVKSDGTNTVKFTGTITGIEVEIGK